MFLRCRHSRTANADRNFREGPGSHPPLGNPAKVREAGHPVFWLPDAGSEGEVQRKLHRPISMEHGTQLIHGSLQLTSCPPGLEARRTLINGKCHDRIMSASDPMSSIPAHRSTIELLQRLKPAKKNWDDFLLSAFEDWVPPETLAELERREQTGTTSTFAQVERRHPDWGKGRRK